MTTRAASRLKVIIPARSLALSKGIEAVPLTGRAGAIGIRPGGRPADEAISSWPQLTAGHPHTPVLIARILHGAGRGCTHRAHHQVRRLAAGPPGGRRRPLLRPPLAQLDLDPRRPTEPTMAQGPLGDRVELAAFANQVPHLAVQAIGRSSLRLCPVRPSANGTSRSATSGVRSWRGPSLTLN